MSYKYRLQHRCQHRSLWCSMKLEHDRCPFEVPDTTTVAAEQDTVTPQMHQPVGDHLATFESRLRRAHITHSIYTKGSHHIMGVCVCAKQAVNGANMLVVCAKFAARIHIRRARDPGRISRCGVADNQITTCKRMRLAKVRQLTSAHCPKGVPEGRL